MKSILLLLCLLNISVRAEWELPPKAATLEQQIELLLAIRGEIPSLVENGTEYDVDIFNIFEIVNQFAPALKGAPGFSTAAKARDSFYTIQASYVRTQILNTFVLTNQAMEDARSSGTGAKLRPGELTELIEQWLKYDARSILTGLATIHEDSVKKNVFRAPSMEEKIQILKSNPLNDSVVKSKFRFEDSGVEMSDRDYKSLIRILQIAIAAESRIWDAVISTFAKDRSVKLENLTSDEILSRLIDLSDGNPTVVEREVRIRSAFESRFFQKVKREVQVVEEQITLREVPGSLAVFRGIVGSDCSTSSSCPIALLPAEHTFFIYDSAGTLRGYLSGTKLKILDEEGRQIPAFYLHDFAGPRLSARTAKLALAGLVHEVEKLGMKQVVVPPSERMIANMNYKVISDALESVVDDSFEEVTNVYQDVSIRNHMINNDPSGATYWGYDSADENATSREIDVKKLGLDKLLVETSKTKSGEIAIRSKGLSKQEATLLMLDLLSPEAMKSARDAAKEAVAEVKAAGYETNGVTYQFRTQAAQHIGEQFDVDASQLAQILKLLQNPKGLKIADYYASAQRAFESAGIKLDEKIIEDHPHYFFEGHLAAPDRLSESDSKMKARTIEFTIGILRRWPNSSSAWEGILANPIPFQQSGRFQSYIRALLVGPEAQLDAFEELLSVGFDFSFLNTDRDQESLELRRASAKSAKIKAALKKVQAKYCEARTGKAG